MSNRFHLSSWIALVALSLFTFGGLATTGCNDNASTVATTPAVDDHDHDGDDHEGHDHEAEDHGDHSHDFATLGDALAEVTELSDEIGKAFEAGTPEDAHDSLHHIGDVLGSTEKLVKNANLDAETKTAATGAVENLFDSFAAIDEKMHGHDGSDFSEVKDTIASAIATLKTAAGKVK